MQLALWGCAVGPNYHPPNPGLGPFHTATSAPSGESASPPPHLATWWDGFNDPLLSRLIERARSQNLDLAAAIARVKQAGRRPGMPARNSCRLSI